MRYTLLDPLRGNTSLTDSVMRDVHVSYKCSAFEDCESLELVQDLVDRAVERLLAKARRAIADKGPIKICVEHHQKQRANDTPLGDFRYLKVYVEGDGPCIIMAY